MVQVAKVVINWTGFAGAPGFTNLYFQEAGGGDFSQGAADNATAKVDTWLGSAIALLPSAVTVQVNPSVEVHDEATGNLVTYFQTAAKPVRLGNNVNNYSAASGAVINWYTNGIKVGKGGKARRVRGRTFLVPVGGETLSADGTLTNAKADLLRAATGQLVAPAGTGVLGVYSRPTVAAPNSGKWFNVSSFTVPDKVAVLRSRRD